MTYYIKRETPCPYKYVIINEGSLYWSTKYDAETFTYVEALNIIKQVGFKCYLERKE